MNFSKSLSQLIQPKDEIMCVPYLFWILTYVQVDFGKVCHQLYTLIHPEDESICEMYGKSVRGKSQEGVHKVCAFRRREEKTHSIATMSLLIVYSCEQMMYVEVSMKIVCCRAMPSGNKGFLATTTLLVRRVLCLNQ